MEQQEISESQLREAAGMLPGALEDCPIQREDCAFCEMARDMKDAVEKNDTPRMQRWANRRLEFMTRMGKAAKGNDSSAEEAERLFRSIIDGTEASMGSYHCVFNVPRCPFCVEMARDMCSTDQTKRMAWVQRMAAVMDAGEMPLDVEERRQHIMRVLSKHELQ